MLEVPERKPKTKTKQFKSSISRKAVAWTLANIDTDRFTVEEPTGPEPRAFDLLLLQMPFGSRAPHLIGVQFQLGPLRKSNVWRLEVEAERSGSVGRP